MVAAALASYEEMLILVFEAGFISNLSADAEKR